MYKNAVPIDVARKPKMRMSKSQPDLAPVVNTPVSKDTKYKNSNRLGTVINTKNNFFNVQGRKKQLNMNVNNQSASNLRNAQFHKEVAKTINKLSQIYPKNGKEMSRDIEVQVDLMPFHETIKQRSRISSVNKGYGSHKAIGYYNIEKKTPIQMRKANRPSPINISSINSQL
jgi:hypothetical protein